MVWLFILIGCIVALIILRVILYHYQHKKFVVTLNFTGMTTEEAEDVLEKRGLLGRPASVNGVWRIEQNFDMDEIVKSMDRQIICIDKEWAKPNSSEYLYACQLVTPLIDLDEVETLKDVMDDLYHKGAVVLSANCIELLFLKGYSKAIAKQVLKRMVSKSPLLYTCLFFPKPLALFADEDSEYVCKHEDGYKELENSMFANYRRAISAILMGEEASAVAYVLAEKLIYEIVP